MTEITAEDLTTVTNFGITLEDVTNGWVHDINVAGATTGVVTGWGALSENDEAGSQTLLAAQVPLVSDNACSTMGIDAAKEADVGTSVDLVGA